MTRFKTVQGMGIPLSPSPLRHGAGVRARTKLTFYGRMDLGIAKYHFELAAGKENFDWA